MAAKRAFIIHGWGGSPNECWIPWLKSELEKEGFLVSAPAMPDPDTPVIEDWINELNEVVIQPDEDVILVGYSIGCQAILRYLEKLPPAVKIGGVVLVAPWLILGDLEDESDWQIADPWLKTPIKEYDVLSHTSGIVAIFSDNDPFVTSDNVDLFRSRFRAEVVVEPGKGHFRDTDSVKILQSALLAVLEVGKK
jgi:predicted alpha/beta hydrolase family esterase